VPAQDAGPTTQRIRSRVLAIYHSWFQPRVHAHTWIFALSMADSSRVHAEGARPVPQLADRLPEPTPVALVLWTSRHAAWTRLQAPPIARTHGRTPGARWQHARSHRGPGGDGNAVRGCAMG
jgi:hypothetical protein